MKTVQSKDGTTIAYDVLGSGPVLIFITGAICSRNFGPIKKDAKTFSEAFTVYNYDRRGRGDSGDTKPYALEREIEDIEALIDAAGGKAFLYGHSSGAVLALEAALRIPDKVLKVVTFDVPYVHDEEGKAKFAKLETHVRELLVDHKHAAALRAFLVGIGMPKAFAYLLPLFPGWRTMKALAPTLNYDISLTRDFPPLQRATKLQIPIYIVYGEKSPASIHSVALHLAKAIPNAELSKFTGQDHMVSAKRLLPLLVHFFRGPLDQ